MVSSKFDTIEKIHTIPVYCFAYCSQFMSNNYRWLHHRCYHSHQHLHHSIDSAIRGHECSRGNLALHQRPMLMNSAAQ